MQTRRYYINLKNQIIVQVHMSVHQNILAEKKYGCMEFQKLRAGTILSFHYIFHHNIFISQSLFMKLSSNS